MPNIDRVPPHSNDAEEAVLGAMLTDEKAIAIAIEILQDSARFYLPIHRSIYEAIIELYDRSSPVDTITVAEELERKNRLQICGGRSYLVDLVSGVATAANTEYYADMVLNKALLREMIDASSQIINNCFREEDIVEDLLDDSEKRIFAIAERRLRSDFAPLGKLIPNTFEAIENYKDTRGGLIGFPSGFSDIDDMTAGLHKGDLIIVAGRPSMGKSALALNITENFCIETGLGAAFFSLEMTKEQLALRLLCSRARISSHKLRTGRMSESEWPKLTTAAGPLADAKFYIDDTPSLTVLQMRAKARRLASKVDLGLVVIDYLQMMTGSRYAENRQQEISMISRGLKALAKELNVPVIAISQLSRLVEQRPDKRPLLSDLRESGAIEQDADVVAFVYRPEYYLSHRGPDDAELLEAEGKAQIIIAKQRNGPTGTINLSFLRDYARFESLARDYQVPVPSGESDIPF